jgi:hypothetical protein
VSEHDEAMAEPVEAAATSAEVPEPADLSQPEHVAAPGVVAPAAGSRDADLALARLHLRVGLVGLARVELETMAGTAELDLRGILDLAEVRWRTGDLRGAGEAAAAYLALAARSDLQPEGPVAHAIVAEAAALRGHDAEAAEAVAGSLAILRTGLGDDDSIEAALDRLFAGIVARGPWPEPEVARQAPSAPPRRLPWELYTGEDVTEPAPPTGAGSVEGGQEGAGPSPADELLGTGRDALAAAEPGRAAIALGLALRTDPGSAPAVVAAVEEAGTLAAATGADGGTDVSEGESGHVPDSALASLAVVHGDALRAAGRDDEAALAYDLARQLASSGEEPATQPAPDERSPLAEIDAADRNSGGGPP